MTSLVDLKYKLLSSEDELTEDQKKALRDTRFSDGSAERWLNAYLERTAEDASSTKGPTHGRNVGVLLGGSLPEVGHADDDSTDDQ